MWRERFAVERLNIAWICKYWIYAHRYLCHIFISEVKRSAKVVKIAEGYAGYIIRANSLERPPPGYRVDAAPSSLVHRPWHLSWRNLVGAVSCITALMRRWRIDQIASNARDRVDHPGENPRSQKGTVDKLGWEKKDEKYLFCSQRSCLEFLPWRHNSTYASLAMGNNLLCDFSSLCRFWISSGFIIRR